MDESKKEDRDKRGGFALLWSKLGASSISEGSSAGTGGGLLATKAGLVTLLLAGSTVAAGIGLLGTVGGPGDVADSERRLSAFLPRVRDSEGAEARRRFPDAAPASSSLEYVVKVKGAPAGSSGEAPISSKPAAAGADRVIPAARSKMASAKGLGEASGAVPRMEPQQGLSGGIGADFQPRVASAGPSLSFSARGFFARTAAGRRLAALAGAKGAAGQLAMTKGVVHGNLNSAQMSSPGYGVTYDGAADGRIGPAAGGSIGAAGEQIGGGGAGVEPVNPAAAEAFKKAPPAPPPGQTDNATPYQGWIYAAVGALAFSGAMLFLAGVLKKKAASMASVSPAHSAALSGWARRCAMAAAAAALSAAAIGLVLAVGYNQILQGGMFAAIGGVLAYQSVSLFGAGP